VKKSDWVGLILALVSPALYAEEVIRADAVSVSGERDEVALQKNASTQKVVVGRKEIENLSVMTVGEVLSKLPGVEVGSNGQRARGMSRDSIQIFVDGERLPGSAMGSYARLPSSELERVEIHRGSSAEFGGSAPLTVNLVLKKALPKRSTEVKAGIGLRGDEPNYQIAWTENGGEGNFSWSVPVSLNFSKSPAKSFTDRRGIGTDHFWQQELTDGYSEMGHHSFSPRFTWKSGRDSVTFTTMLFLGPSEQKTNTNLYKAGDVNSPLAFDGTRGAFQDADYQAIRLRLQGEKYIGESKLSGRISTNNRVSTSNVTRNSLDLNAVQSTVIENTRGIENEFNGALRWDQPIDLHYVSVGAEYVKLSKNDKQFFNDTGSSRYETSSADHILWVQDAWTPKDEITLTTGLRLESMDLHSEATDQSHLGVLPSVALKWQPEEAWVFRTSLGAGMKMPKLNEISNTVTRSVAVNTPLVADQRGNANLKPERSINFEAVAERYLAQKLGVISANVYVRATDDFTERRVALEGDSPNQRWVDRPYNAGDALHWGLEFDGKVQTDPWGWSGGTLKAHLTLPHARVDDALLGVTRMARDTPKYVMSMGLDQSLPKWQSSFGLSLQLSGRSETDIPGEQKAYTEARALLDAFWLYKLSPKFNLRVSAQNLLDEDTRRQSRYFTSSSEYQLIANDYGYRTLMVMLEGRW